MDTLEELDMYIKRHNISEYAIEAISQKERIKFFDKFRELMAIKDAEGDKIALDVLSWAYQELAD